MSHLEAIQNTARRLALTYFGSEDAKWHSIDRLKADIQEVHPRATSDEINQVIAALRVERVFEPDRAQALRQARAL